MGGGVSYHKNSPTFRCPQDYDQSNFYKIINLYNHLDISSNEPNDEIQQIATILVDIKKQQLLKELFIWKEETKKINLFLKLQLDERIKRIKNQYLEDNVPEDCENGMGKSILLTDGGVSI